jgi:aspartyl protease family protein
MRLKQYASVICGLSLVTIASISIAQSVNYTGAFGNKALLVINGGAPKALAPGEASQGVKLISSNADQAVVEVANKRLTLPMGGGPGSVASSTGQQTVILKADGRGHYITTAQVNSATVQFLFDTGASMVVINKADAERAGINYKNAPVGYTQTANGVGQMWRVKIDRLRIGELELNNVDAAVNDAPMPFGLLGMSAISRTDMKREGENMVLTKRF